MCHDMITSFQTKRAHACIDSLFPLLSSKYLEAHSLLLPCPHSPYTHTHTHNIKCTHTTYLKYI